MFTLVNVSMVTLRLMRVFACFALALALLGCEPPRSPVAEEPPTILEEEYLPRISRQPGRTAVAAVRIYEGDVPELPREAEILGSYVALVDGRKSEPEVWRAIAEEVAKRGGTHYLLAANNSYERIERTRDSGAEVALAISSTLQSMNCDNLPTGVERAHCRDRVRGPRRVYEERRIPEKAIAVVVVAVRPKEWEHLPEILRPVRWRY